jgi:Holliday junction resolvasome RuvABC endonuclease subunit
LEKAIVAGPKGSQTRAQMALGFRGCIMGVCRLHGVPFHEIPVQTARKYFIGRGDYPGEVAKKMSLEQCKRLGWAAKNLDEADAAAVWACAREELFKIQTPMVGWAASGDGMNEGRKPISRRSTSA